MDARRFLPWAESINTMYYHRSIKYYGSIKCRRNHFRGSFSAIRIEKECPFIDFRVNPAV
jgi:hypothetical protein